MDQQIHPQGAVLDWVTILRWQQEEQPQQYQQPPQFQPQHPYQHQHQLQAHASTQSLALPPGLNNPGPANLGNTDFFMESQDGDDANVLSEFGDMDFSMADPTVDISANFSTPATNFYTSPSALTHAQNANFHPYNGLIDPALTGPMGDPQGFTSQGAIPQTVSLQTVSPQTVSQQTVYPQMVSPQTVYPQMVSPQVVIPQTVYPQAVNPQAVIPQAVSPQTNVQQNTGDVPGKRTRGRPRGNRLHGESPSEVSDLVHDSWNTAEISYSRLKRAENRLDEFKKKGPADGKKQLTEGEKERGIKKMEKCLAKNRDRYSEDVEKYRKTKESEAAGKYDHLPATNVAEANLSRCQQRLAARKAKYTQAASRRGISPVDRADAASVPTNGEAMDGNPTEVATEADLDSLSPAAFNKAEAMWTYSAEKAVKEQEHFVARCRERDRAVEGLAAIAELSERSYQAVS